MYVDSQNLISDAQAVSADAVSTNTIDLGNVTPKNEIGSGEPMCFAVQVDVAADVANGDETYVFEVIQSANANLSSPDILMQREIARASLTAGSIHFLPIPPGSVTKRYLGMNYNVGGTTPSVTVTTFLIPMSQIDTFKAYAKGYTIS
jgi:hypothetical protein